MIIDKAPITPANPEKFEEDWKLIYPHFSYEKELKCPCCGETYVDFEFMDKLTAARLDYGKPMKVNSGHRCPSYNAKTKGASNRSEHRYIAVDISTRSHEPLEMLKALDRSGLTTFGLALTFIHTDPRPNRLWFYGQESEDFWLELMTEDYAWTSPRLRHLAQQAKKRQPSR